jgi:hypothetical protein
MKFWCILLFFYYPYSALSITLDLEENGEIRYSLQDVSTRHKAKIESDPQTFKDKKVSITISYEIDEGYRIHSLENLGENNDAFSLLINSKQEVYLGDESLNDERTYEFKKFQLVGTRTDNYVTWFENNWRCTISENATNHNNVAVFKSVNFTNNSTISFEGNTILPLLGKGCFFVNWGTSTFKGELHFFEGSSAQKAFFKHKSSYNNHIQNYGLIDCEKSIWLTGDIFIAENKGSFKSRENIYYEYDTRQTRALNSIKRDIDYPIYAITRIPEDLREKYRSLSSGGFGESCALDYYNNHPLKFKAFLYKANTSENGIDVWAYSQKNRILCIHESKNYQNNDYPLQSQQMTREWCLRHLLDAFQAILKEQLYCIYYGLEGKKLEDKTLTHMQEAFSIIVKEDYKPLLKNILHEDYKEALKKACTLEAKKCSLEQIKEIFNLSHIAARGNSIYYSTLIPVCENVSGIKLEAPQVPTYYFQRRLQDRFKTV